MPGFILKTEPASYSHADLTRERRATWDGVRNPVALAHIRRIKKGDTLVVYHTGGEKRAVGLAKAASNAYPDPKLDDEKVVVFDLEAGPELSRPVTLAELRSDSLFRDSELVRIPRLSVIPITDAQLERLLELSGTRPR